MSKKKYTRINERIRISPVRVIDETGEMIGVIETSEALQKAKDKGLDLVEVSPNARPPVCKIMDYGQYKYQQEKDLQKQKKKQKKVGMKGIRISMRISENDYNFKVKQAQKFLDAGNKVRVELVMRGREKAHMALAREQLFKFKDSLEGDIILEQKPKRERRGMGIILAMKQQ